MLKTTEIKNSVKDISFLQAIGGSISPLTVSVINTIAPTLIGLITSFEQWSPEYELPIRLGRTYASNVFNLYILAFSYILLADPYLLPTDSMSIRNQVEVKFSKDAYQCRIDQVASDLFLLVVTDRISQDVLFFLTAFISIVIGWVRQKDPVKTEFDVINSAMSVINSSGLAMLAFPFAPLSMLLVPIFLATSYKWNVLIVNRCYSKPKKPWKSSKAGIVFTRLYLFSVLLIAIPSCSFFLSSARFPKNCFMQDEHVRACLDGTLQPNGTCILDGNSYYYEYFSKTENCNAYPLCICAGKLACGPFVDNLSGIEPFRIFVAQTETASFFWDLIFTRSYFAWFSLIITLLILALRRNTVYISKETFADKENSLEAKIQALQSEKEHHLKLIKKFNALHNSKDS